ncbi:MAG: 2,3-bisphosphoglycerate-independent phosphoglycerate mutase [Candidatus Berkelbacteria bacterium]
MNKFTEQVVLIVLDGWGYTETTEHNGIFEAQTPYFDYLWQNFPHSLLEASGEAVGLPNGQMGNSEVGHTIIGAGKIVNTDLVKISKSIERNEFNQNSAFLELFNHIKKHNSTLHVQGLIGHGGVHSHSQHLFAFLKAAKESGIEKIAIHIFTDGRDSAPQSAGEYIKELENILKEIGIGFIATASGRFYAMDRDNNWDRLTKTEQAIFHGTAKSIQTNNPSQIIEELYKDGIVDEHIEPIIFLDENGKNYTISDNDGILFFNFRKDRSRMLSQKILDQKKNKNLCFVTMTEYDKNFDCLVAFPPEEINTTLAKEISEAGLDQAHIAETEKFAHVTYYFNGGRQTPYKNEKQILIDSRKDIQTHDQAPQMKAREIAEKSTEEIKNHTNFILINFANPDMIGHTANKKALLESLSFMDKQLEKVVKEAINHNYKIIVTADHGNAEIYFDSNSNEKHTAHTTNKVPFIIIDQDKKSVRDGGLADIAPTILELLNIKKPEEMTGQSIFVLK